MHSTFTILLSVIGLPFFSLAADFEKIDLSTTIGTSPKCLLERHNDGVAICFLSSKPYTNDLTVMKLSIVGTTETVFWCTKTEQWGYNKDGLFTVQLNPSETDYGLNQLVITQSHTGDNYSDEFRITTNALTNEFAYAPNHGYSYFAPKRGATYRHVFDKNLSSCANQQETNGQ